MMEWITVLLILVVVLQQAFWSWMMQKLVNKILAGDYGSYVQAKTMEARVRRDERGNPLGKGFDVKLPSDEELAGMRALEELNSMIPR